MWEEREGEEREREREREREERENLGSIITNADVFVEGRVKVTNEAMDKAIDGYFELNFGVS